MSHKKEVMEKRLSHGRQLYDNPKTRGVGEEENLLVVLLRTVRPLTLRRCSRLNLACSPLSRSGLEHRAPRQAPCSAVVGVPRGLLTGPVPELLRLASRLTRSWFSAHIRGPKNRQFQARHRGAAQLFSQSPLDAAHWRPDGMPGGRVDRSKNCLLPELIGFSLSSTPEEQSWT